MLVFLQLFWTLIALYLLVGLLVAIVRISAHDMPWQLFVFTIVFWPSMWAA